MQQLWSTQCEVGGLTCSSSGALSVRCAGVFAALEHSVSLHGEALYDHVVGHVRRHGR